MDFHWIPLPSNRDRGARPLAIPSVLMRLHLPASPVGLGADRMDEAQRPVQKRPRDDGVEDPGPGPDAQPAVIPGPEAGRCVTRRRDEPVRPP